MGFSPLTDCTDAKLALRGPEQPASFSHSCFQGSIEIKSSPCMFSSARTNALVMKFIKGNLREHSQTEEEVAGGRASGQLWNHTRTVE